MDTRSNNQLENLDANKREWLLEIASSAARLVDVLEPLKEVGIEVSVSTLRRFVNRYRQERMIEEGEEMGESVTRMAGRGKGELLRKGTIEALRQKIYEEALDPRSSKAGTMELYESLLREEAKLKELELAERKTAALEERVRLEGERLRVAGAPRLPEGKNKTQVEVHEVEVVSEGTAREAMLLEALRKVEEIVNVGGPAEEKVLALRSFLGGEQKLLGGA